MANIEPVKLGSLSFGEHLYVPIKTRTNLDTLFSTQGGLFPGTNTVVVGDPGVGKSTVCLDILANIEAQGKRVLFISAEMNEIEMFPYLKRYPKFGAIPTVFPGNYHRSMIQILEEVLYEGYDVVLIDSLAEVADVIKMERGITRNEAEVLLLDIFDKHNKGENIAKLNTAFLVIQQITKGGVFVGSNKIKHMTTAMMEMRFEQDKINRHIVFTKNRRGVVGETVPFMITKDTVTYSRPQHSDPTPKKRGRPSKEDSPKVYSMSI